MKLSLWHATGLSLIYEVIQRCNSATRTFKVALDVGMPFHLIINRIPTLPNQELPKLQAPVVLVSAKPMV